MTPEQKRSASGGTDSILILLVFGIGRMNELLPVAERDACGWVRCCGCMNDARSFRVSAC